MKKSIAMLCTVSLIAMLFTSCKASGIAESLGVSTKTTTVQPASETVTNEYVEEPIWSNNASITFGDSVSVSGKGASVSGMTVTITAEGIYTVSGQASDGKIVVNTDAKVKLLLNGLTLSNTTGSVISVTNADKTFIELADGSENVLSDASTYASDSEKAVIFSNDNVELFGGGKLTLTGHYKHAIAVDDELYISGGTIVLSAAVDGIHVNDNIVVNAGNIQVSKANDAIESEGYITINGGTFTLASEDDGITAQSDVKINGGTFTIQDCYEGIESKTKLEINGGVFDITCSDDGLNAATDLTINDGRIYSYSTKGDALDSNGSLTINGGTILAIGSQQPESGADCDNNTFLINGGILIASGGENSMPNEKSEQCSVSFGSLGSDSYIQMAQDGTDVLTFKISADYNSLLVSAPGLENGKAYTVYTGGSVSGGTDFHGLCTKGTYSGGTQNTTFTISSTVTTLGGNTGMGGGMKGGGGTPPDVNGGTPPDGNGIQNGNFLTGQ